jgi:N-acetylmuramoyl-L-alanine amidase
MEPGGVTTLGGTECKRGGVRPFCAVFVFCALVAASCGTGSSDVLTAGAETVPAAVDVGSVTSSSTTTTTSASTTTSTTTTTPAPPPSDLVRGDDGVPLNGQTAGVLRTPTGWLVPVVQTVDDGWLVWTPCGRLDTVAAGEYFDQVDFVLDPGHGGSEPGAVGPAGTREADLNLAVTKRAQVALEAAGYSVLLTRDTDVRVPIVTRAELALALDPVAFLSIHHNAGTDAVSSTPGTEMYFQLASADSRRLAGLLYEETRAALDLLGSSWFALDDAGTMPRPNREGGDFYGVLRRPATVTSVLVEFAYITNPAEEALLNRADVQDALAGAVVNAATRFLETSDPGAGYVDDPIFRGYAATGAGRTNNCDDPDLHG